MFSLKGNHRGKRNPNSKPTSPPGIGVELRANFSFTLKEKLKAFWMHKTGKIITLVADKVIGNTKVNHYNWEPK